jgi:hypothetical protein
MSTIGCSEIRFASVVASAASTGSTDDSSGAEVDIVVIESVTIETGIVESSGCDCRVDKLSSTSDESDEIVAWSPFTGALTTPFSMIGTAELDKTASFISREEKEVIGCDESSCATAFGGASDSVSAFDAAAIIFVASCMVGSASFELPNAVGRLRASISTSMVADVDW